MGFLLSNLALIVELKEEHLTLNEFLALSSLKEKTYVVHIKERNEVATITPRKSTNWFWWVVIVSEHHTKVMQEKDLDVIKKLLS